MSSRALALFEKFAQLEFKKTGTGFRYKSKIW